MMWWLMWCAVVLVCRTAAAPASDNLQLQTLDLAQLDPPAPDDENLGYGYTSLGGRYSAGSPWFYLLSGVPRDSQNGLVEDAEESRNRPKRKMPSLSINNPMEVLRQRLLLEVARKQMREASQRQAFANRLFLQNVGKRGYWAKSALSRTRYDN